MNAAAMTKMLDRFSIEPGASGVMSVSAMRRAFIAGSRMTLARSATGSAASSAMYVGLRMNGWYADRPARSPIGRADTCG